MATLNTGGSPNRGRKTIWHLQQMKDKGEVITQFSPGMLDPIFTQAAERAGVDICRYIAPGENVEHVGQNFGWWTRYIRETSKIIHLNSVVPTHFYSDKYTAVKECSKIICDGADSILPMGVTNEVVEYMTNHNIPVFGHIAILSYWQVTNVGGFRRIGKTADDAYKVFRKAYEYQESGMKAMTIEMTPREVSHAIAKKMRVPVISIAGSDACDGSELVMHDMFKLIPEESMGIHAKIYGDFYGHFTGGFKAFADDVRSGEYPKENNGWSMDEKELDKFMNLVEQKH